MDWFHQVRFVKFTSLLFSLLFGTTCLSHLIAESLWVAGQGGIYHCELAEESGRLSEPSLACEYPSGSFLAIHPERDVIYSTYGNRPEFGYVSLVPTGEGRKLEIQSLKILESGSGPPSHLSVSADGRMLVGAHYASESNFFFEVGVDGGLSRDPLHLRQTGSGPKRAQSKSRPHWGGFTDNDSVFHSVDLGSDEVWTYQVDTVSGKVDLLHRMKFPLGTGPRHMALNLKSEYAYVNGEFSLEVTTLHYDDANFRFSPLQHISAVAQGESSEGSSLSEIQIHPSGRFLYTAVRGSNLITVFRVDEDTGLLEVVEWQDSIVKRPRNFTVSQSGKWLVAAGQDSSDLLVFSIDAESGALEPTDSRVSVPKPVCVRAWGRL